MYLKPIFMKLKFLSFIALLTFQLSNAQYTDIVNSNRPSESMSAFAVGRTVIQLEGGFGFINEKDNTFAVNTLDYKANGVVADLNVRYGFFKEQLEAVLELSHQRDTQEFSDRDRSRNGLKVSTIGLKYLVYDPYKFYEENVNLYSWKANQKFKMSQLIPIVAVYGGMNLNFSNNKFLIGAEELAIISPKLMLITQNIFGEQLVFITNTFLDKIATEGQQLGYLLTLTKGFNERWSAFTEIKGLSNKFYKDNFISAGGAYLLLGNLQIDASISKSLKNSPSIMYGGIGLTWRSDSNYKDHLIKSPEKNKADKAKKEKKKKNNEKKMLDKLPKSNEKEE
jgi:hypothetical protein